MEVEADKEGRLERRDNKNEEFTEMSLIGLYVSFSLVISLFGVWTENSPVISG